MASSADELARVLERSRVGFRVTRKPAAAADKWRLIDGALQHDSRGFFSVTGVHFAGDAEPALVLYQPQGAVTGCIVARIDGQCCWLLQARAEPGCLNEAQYGPTVQSTPANFMRLHAGKRTAYVDAFVHYAPQTSLIDDTTQLDLGERYLFKSKRSVLVQINFPETPQSGYVWATPSAIAEAVTRSAFLNIDLRSVIAISPWSTNPDGGELSPLSPLVCRSLSEPIRPEVIGQIFSRLRSPPDREARFVSLDSLSNWRATEWGWEERQPHQGFAIDFYEVTAAFREVPSWIQPLVNSNSEGHAALACRERAGRLEVYVRARSERGLATSVALAPSYLRYPGQRAAAPAWLEAGQVWSELRASDEGGRFYQDVSRYQLVRVDDLRDFPEDLDGAWLTVAELKMFLRTSNACTIQLRGITAQLLGVT